MSDNGIRVNEPHEVAQALREKTALLRQYEEIVGEDINYITSVEGNLIAARERIKVKIRELEMALQRTKAMAETSEQAKAIARNYEAKISKYNRDLQEITHYQSELGSLKNEMKHIGNEITSVSRDHHNLQSKINTILNKILEAF